MFHSQCNTWITKEWSTERMNEIHHTYTTYERTTEQMTEQKLKWLITPSFFTPFSRLFTGYRWLCGFKELFVPHCPPTCLGGKPSDPSATTTDASPRNTAKFVHTATTASLTRDDLLDSAYAVIGSSRPPTDAPTPRVHETGKDHDILLSVY